MAKNDVFQFGVRPPSKIGISITGFSLLS